MSADSEDVVITAAYKALMKKYHPDRNRGDAAAEARAKRINQAYDVLCDAVRRAAYDAGRRGASDPPPPPPPPPPPASPSPSRGAESAGADQRARTPLWVWAVIAVLTVPLTIYVTLPIVRAVLNAIGLGGI